MRLPCLPTRLTIPTDRSIVGWRFFQAGSASCLRSNVGAEDAANRKLEAGTAKGSPWIKNAGSKSQPTTE
jgi:hypothetical protein